MPAGRLRYRLRFEARSTLDDGYGNEESGDWVAQFTVWAGVKKLRGGETVIADRLAGKTPAILTVRKSSQSEGILPEWRAVDTRSGEIWNIREAPREADHRGYLELLAETGGVT